MKTVHDFKEYQIIDMASGMKLESWNGIEYYICDQFRR